MVASDLLIDKYLLSVMNLHDELHHSKHAANKGGRSALYDKLAAEQSRQCLQQ